MAEISYEQNNNVCFNDALGSIIIDQINLVGVSEQTSFASFTIQWSGSFDSLSQISTDGRLAQFLKNGNYSFSILSLIDSSILGPYNITISSPPELIITNVKYNKYACSSDGGLVRIYISGGTPPYSVSAGGVSDITSNSDILLSGIIPGEFDIVVSDANNCSYTYDRPLTILDSTIDVTFTEILSPTLYNSYGSVRLNITGYGPFNMWFTNLLTNEIIYIDGLSTEYISNVIDDTIYEYLITDKLIPGEYSVSIKNNFGCSIEQSLEVPNLAPMSVSCFIANDDRETFANKQLSLPIFDTILIPYKYIQQNSTLWQLIKEYNLKDSISINIDGVRKNYKIVRYMLDKYCLDENRIEILRLGNSSDEWFYYLYIAPSVNVAANFSLVNSSYEIINPLSGETYPLTLGLSSDNNIDKENPSLIRGSFLLNGIDHNQFVNSATYINYTDRQNNAYISFEDSISSDHDFFVQNISKKVLKNIYLAGYVTAINFLEQFNRLNIYVNVNDTACTSSNDDYQYMLKIKSLIKEINNLNNISNTYIFNLDNIPKLGQIVLSIDGPESFLLSDGITQANAYDINYYYFDEDSTKLLNFYQNNEPVKTQYLKNVSSGYVIVRIKDIYSNIPRTINLNNTIVEYDNHFVVAKNIIQKLNPNITPLFLYGDILCYIGSKENPLPPIIDPSIPQPPPPTPPTPPVSTENIVEQTHDISNTASLIVNLYADVTCILYGPKNYEYSFNTNITFTNMIPGVYRIVGNNKELIDNNLYPQEFRIVIDKNTTNTIDIDFISYRDRVFLKETT